MLAIFQFQNTSRKPSSLFTFFSAFKHVDILIFNRHWMRLRLDDKGITPVYTQKQDMYEVLIGFQRVPSVIVQIAIELKERKSGFTLLPLMTCNELARRLSGCDIGFTVTPYHLYKKLLKYDHIRNYDVIYAWRRDNGWRRR